MTDAGERPSRLTRRAPMVTLTRRSSHRPGTAVDKDDLIYTLVFYLVVLPGYSLWPPALAFRRIFSVRN